MNSNYASIIVSKHNNLEESAYLSTFKLHDLDLYSLIIYYRDRWNVWYLYEIYHNYRKVSNLKLIYLIFLSQRDKYKACKCRTKLYAGARVSYCWIDKCQPN